LLIDQHILFGRGLHGKDGDVRVIDAEQPFVLENK